MTTTLTENDNKPSSCIGRKHNDNKSHGMTAYLQSEKRKNKQSPLLTENEESLPSAGHGKPVVRRLTSSSKKMATYLMSELSNQYEETVQGENDAYEEKEDEDYSRAKDEFFEEHFRLLKELSEKEYQDYLEKTLRPSELEVSRSSELEVSEMDGWEEDIELVNGVRREYGY
jgi:hypothetical protein